MSVTHDRANHAYNQGEPGFYVVNHDTQIAVAGPYSRETMAENEMLSINARYLGVDARPDGLRVYEVAA